MHFKIRLVFFLFFSTCVFVAQSIAQNINNELEKEINYCLKKSDSCKIKYDYTNSIRFIAKAVSFSKKNNDINTEILCNIKLIELYRHASLFSKADFYLNKTEQLIRSNKTKVSDFNLMYLYNRKAALFSEYYHSPDSTLFYSKKSLMLSDKLKNKNFQFTSLMEIGFFYEQEQDFTSAIKYYRKAFKLAENLKNKHQTCDALVNLARTFEKAKNFQEAIDISNKGLSILEGSNNFFHKFHFYDIKRKGYEKQGDKVTAYDNLKLRIKYADLHNEKNIRDKFVQEENKNELFEKNKEILKNKKDINEIKKNQLLLMSIVLLFVLGFLSLLYYSKKIRYANKQLDFYSKENAFLLKEANHRINNNLQLIVILISDELRKADTNETIKLKKILSKIEAISTLHKHLYQTTNKNEIDISNYLNEIKINFNEIFDVQNIKVKINIDKFMLPIDQGMYLGLLITELFINSIKHAFDNQDYKKINFELKNCNQEYIFTYKDNGKKNISAIIKPVLVDKLCRQLRVKYDINVKDGFQLFFNKIK